MTDIETPLTLEEAGLVEENVDLAKYLAFRKWQSNPAKLDLDELTSVAYQGLIAAARRFDPEKSPAEEASKKFSTYARHRINGAIMDWQRQEDPAPRDQRKLYKELQELGYGESRSASQVASILGLDEDHVRSVIAVVEQKTLSLDYQFEPTADAASTVDMHASTSMPDVAGPDSSAVVTSVTEAFVLTWDELPDLQRKVIALKYYAGEDLASISQVLGVSPTLVRAAHNEALEVLHHAMKAQVM